MRERLEVYERHLMTRGPNRVLVTKDQAMSFPRAYDLGFRIDIIFVRKDGWSLGADATHETDALRLWRNEWVAYWRLGQQFARDIKEYPQ